MDDLAVEDIERVVRVQKIVRARLARRRASGLAGDVYRKCLDAVSGFTYYCNLRTGGTSWQKPSLLGVKDADWINSISTAAESGSPEKDSDPAKQDANQQGVAPPSLASETAPGTAEPADETLTRLNSQEWHERFAESVAFQQKCQAEKLALIKKHRRRVARAMRDWEQKMLDDKQRVRADRQAQLVAENQLQKQSLREGDKRENTESIREAALRGHTDRIQELLAMGFHPDAESAMGLTPLFAACQSGHLDVVKLLLSRGADVNHVHVKTGRTALMEASCRTSVSIVKELLRYGARIHMKDAQGENVFDGIKASGVRDTVSRACEVWTPGNAALFPSDFRQASLTLALIATRQRAMFVLAKAKTRRDLIQTKQRLQRELVECRVRYDESLRLCSMAPSVVKKLAVVEQADERFDSERRALVLELQDAADALSQSEQPRFFTDDVVYLVLSFCSRHWFEVAQRRRIRRKGNRKRDSEQACSTSVCSTRLRDPPEQLPNDLRDEWTAFQRELKELCARLASAQAIERFDVANGVTKTADGESLAELDVLVVQAENLPWRDPRFHEMVDPFLRVFLRSREVEATESTEEIDSELRIGSRDPVWNFHCRLKAVPSTQLELGIQVIDEKRAEVAGEAFIALRTLLDQREHDEWHVLPPTLRQQILERTPRELPARIRVKVTFSHTKSLVLTRELQAMLKVRDGLIKTQRDYIQQVVNRFLQRLP